MVFMLAVLDQNVDFLCGEPLTTQSFTLKNQTTIKYERLSSVSWQQDPVISRESKEMNEDYFWWTTFAHAITRQRFSLCKSCINQINQTRLV